jgi:hypothetical protein
MSPLGHQGQADARLLRLPGEFLVLQLFIQEPRGLGWIAAW